MKISNLNTIKISSQKSQHSHHLWMMAVCCGLPIIGFLAIGVLGVQSPSLETLIALICPIGMVAMMFMMRKSSNENPKDPSCCTAKDTQVQHNAIENSRNHCRSQ